MFDLKIVNGRIGRDKQLGNYTCYTTTGQSTIDYAVASMELFPKIVDFYIDVFDKCMSDVHCPVCLIISNESTVNDFEERIIDNIDYNRKDKVVIRWNQELSEQYTFAFNDENIAQFQKQLNDVFINMSGISQEIIDGLYTTMKDLFFAPAKTTNMYNESKSKTRKFVKRPRKYGNNDWFNEECEVLRKEYMSTKNSLMSKTCMDVNLLHAQAKKYKMVISKTKMIHTRKFHSQIRGLKARNRNEFWKIIKSTAKIKKFCN